MKPTLFDIAVIIAHVIVSPASATAQPTCDFPALGCKIPPKHDRPFDMKECEVLITARFANTTTPEEAEAWCNDIRVGA